MLLRGKVGWCGRRNILSCQVQGPASQLGLLVLLLFTRVAQEWAELCEEDDSGTIAWDVPCRAVPRGLRRKEGFLFPSSSARAYLPTYLFRTEPQPTLSTILLWHQIRIIEMEGASGVLRLYACVRVPLIPVIERGVGGCVCCLFCCCYDDDECEGGICVFVRRKRKR